MKRKIELPLLEPLYSTYHGQGIATAIITDNPSIRNWYFNQVLMLSCTLKFLNGFTTPQVTVEGASWASSPFFDKKIYDTRFLKGYTHYVIKNLLNEGYYVCFRCVDDYYVEGKSWYHERHFAHDGCICGYDQESKKYCLYAYDNSWIFRKFWTSQKSLDAGMKAMFKKGKYDVIYGLKAKNIAVDFSYNTALDKIEEYINASIWKDYDEQEETVSGIVVHDYIAKYIEKLYDGSIPYERMDRRVFRTVWEHKKVMLERIKLIEQSLLLDTESSTNYISVVKDADNIRMLYASHHMKRRDEVLPIILKKLTSIKDRELEILKNLLEKSDEKRNETMELY